MRVRKVFAVLGTLLALAAVVPSGAGAVEETEKSGAKKKNFIRRVQAKTGYIGEVYGLPRHLFDEGSIERWAERRGVLIKAIEDTALAMASVCRSLDVPLPKTLPMVNVAMRRNFCDLLARVMPFDLVIDEETDDGQEARVSKTSVCGSWGPITGTLRYFADRFGVRLREEIVRLGDWTAE